MRGGARCSAQCDEIYSNIDFDEIMIGISMFAKRIYSPRNVLQKLKKIRQCKIRFKFS